VSAPVLAFDRVYRRKTARRYFLDGHWDESTAKKYYEKWRDSPEYMMGEYWTFEAPNQVHEGWITNRERVSWRLPKRGDPLYKKNLKDKFKWMTELPSTPVFNPKDRVRHKTRMLFVTWSTHAPDRRYSEKLNKYDSWREDSKVVNRCMQRLRNHYGEVQYFRMNEGTQRGYPAPHGILFFPEKEWTVYLKAARRGKTSRWRLINSQWRELKGIIEGADVRAKPVLGFTDIEGIWNPKGALKYLVNYLVGSASLVNSDHAVAKQAAQDAAWFWLWVTGKHTYSASRRFQVAVAAYLEYTRLDTGTLGISKVVWVSLVVGDAKEAEAWNNDHMEPIYAGMGTLDDLIRRALRKKEGFHEKKNA